jgi:hypothetical protein
VGDPNCLSLIGYGQIVLRSRPGLQLEVRKVPIMMKFMPLRLMQGKAKEEEEVPTNHSKEENVEQLLSIKRKIFQRFSASNVKFGHYARHCPLWKNSKQHASTVDVD